MYTWLGMVPRVAGRPDGPCDPRAPVQTPKPLGAGTGDWDLGGGCPLPLERLRSPGLRSLGSFREGRFARTLALAVRVV